MPIRLKTLRFQYLRYVKTQSYNRSIFENEKKKNDIFSREIYNTWTTIRRLHAIFLKQNRKKYTHTSIWQSECKSPKQLKWWRTTKNCLCRTLNYSLPYKLSLSISLSLFQSVCSCILPYNCILACRGIHSKYAFVAFQLFLCEAVSANVCAVAIQKQNHLLFTATVLSFLF